MWQDIKKVNETAENNNTGIDCRSYLKMVGAGAGFAAGGTGLMSLGSQSDILEVLEDGRNVPGNIALKLDKSRGYVRSQLPQLRDHGLVQKEYEEGEFYSISEKGRRYLVGEIDADELEDTE